MKYSHKHTIWNLEKRYCKDLMCMIYTLLVLNFPWWLFIDNLFFDNTIGLISMALTSNPFYNSIIYIDICVIPSQRIRKHSPGIYHHIAMYFSLQLSDFHSRPVFWQTLIHYSYVVMGAMASQITSLTIVYSTVYSGAENIKALCGEFTGERWIPRTNDQ